MFNCFQSAEIEKAGTALVINFFLMQTGETRPIYHFHYLTWPDFGVPTSPATFLAFLFEVRKTGVMSADDGPCVIHCR